MPACEGVFAQHPRQLQARRPAQGRAGSEELEILKATRLENEAHLVAQARSEIGYTPKRKPQMLQPLLIVTNLKNQIPMSQNPMHAY